MNRCSSNSIWKRPKCPKITIFQVSGGQDLKLKLIVRVNQRSEKGNELNLSWQRNVAGNHIWEPENEKISQLLHFSIMEWLFWPAVGEVLWLFTHIKHVIPQWKNWTICIIYLQSVTLLYRVQYFVSLFMHKHLSANQIKLLFIQHKSYVKNKCWT